jgi:hypothetical protein
MTSYTDAERERLLAEARRILNRGRHSPSIPVGSQDTDVDEFARRAEELCAQTQAILQAERSRREEQEAEKQRREEDGWRYVLQDLRSTNEGRRLGREYNHDSFWLARALGVTVQYLSIDRLQDPSRPSETKGGRLLKLPGRPIAQLADCLKGFELHRMLAHEIGHHLGFPDERLCDQFADNFLKMTDEELRAWFRRR